MQATGRLYNMRPLSGAGLHLPPLRSRLPLLQ